MFPKIEIINALSYWSLRERFRFATYEWYNFFSWLHRNNLNLLFHYLSFLGLDLTTGSYFFFSGTLAYSANSIIKGMEYESLSGKHTYQSLESILRRWWVHPYPYQRHWRFTRQDPWNNSHPRKHRHCWVE